MTTVPTEKNLADDITVAERELMANLRATGRAEASLGAALDALGLARVRSEPLGIHRQRVTDLENEIRERRHAQPHLDHALAEAKARKLVEQTATKRQRLDKLAEQRLAMAAKVDECLTQLSNLVDTGRSLADESQLLWTQLGSNRAQGLTTTRNVSFLHAIAWRVKAIAGAELPQTIVPAYGQPWYMVESNNVSDEEA